MKRLKFIVFLLLVSFTFSCTNDEYLNNGYITYQVDNHPIISLTSNIIHHDLGSSSSIYISSPTDSRQAGVPFFGIYLSSNDIRSYNSTTDNSNVIFYDSNTDLLASEFDSNITMNLTKYGAIGEYIDIDFSGTWSNGSNNPPFFVSGSIHAIRKY